MKLALIAASGRTGMHVLEQALEEGHEVIAIVRTPSKITVQHDNLKVVTGDVLSTESLKEHFEGCDAVMSCLGAGALRNVTIYSESIKHIVQAARENSIKKLIIMTSWGSFSDPNDRGPFLIEWILRPLVLGSVLDNMSVMETYLKNEAQDLDFITVRPPGLKDGPKTDKEILHEERNFVGGAPGTMMRADVARFMLQCLKTDEFNKKWIAIGTK
ncbi:Flavin reductase (NADPH) [Holothuria leucospilota]|uniref:Flavin reductase (NADPH) n=1 Tax=Holothuria leucospilota TaxID=206669 RepID=A0A9Q0YU85_HOLLE|nr:Flavin reductase (NADPH) [Holothuria leucospilota]